MTGIPGRAGPDRGGRFTGDEFPLPGVPMEARGPGRCGQLPGAAIRGPAKGKPPVVGAAAPGTSAPGPAPINSEVAEAAQVKERGCLLAGLFSEGARTSFHRAGRRAGKPYPERACCGLDGGAARSCNRGSSGIGGGGRATLRGFAAGTFPEGPSAQPAFLIAAALIAPEGSTPFSARSTSGVNPHPRAGFLDALGRCFGRPPSARAGQRSRPRSRSAKADGRRAEVTAGRSSTEILVLRAID